MFKEIVDLLVQFGSGFIPFVIVNEYERAVVLRLGRYNRTLEPGYRWIIPFFVEDVLKDNVVPRTYNLDAQSLVTIDKKEIVLSTAINCEIVDIRKATLEVEAVDSTVCDVCYGEIGRQINKHTFDEISDQTFPTVLKNSCNRLIEPYGIKINKVGIIDLSPTHTFRLINQ